MSTETYVITGTGTDAKATIVKDPDAVLDYTFDWTTWLALVTDTISSKTITVDTGITCTSSSISGTTVIVWLSGGSVGATYKVTCRIVTASGRTDDRSIYVKIKER
jgi:hypothetical protein